MPIVLGIFFIIGVIVGIQVMWSIQVALIFLFITLMNSSHVKGMEIGAILPYIMGVAFFSGVLAGDISWVFQTDAWTTWNISNPFVVNPK